MTIFPYRNPDLKDRSRELRSGATLAEDRLWQALRRQALRVKFRRQVPYGRYILDFLCVSCGLAIEVDGSQHRDNPYDQQRDAWLDRQGIMVLRFWNNEVMIDLGTVLEVIDRAVRDLSGAPAPCPRPEGVGDFPGAGRAGKGAR